MLFLSDLILAILTSVIKKDNWPAIGYFCRINSQNGFDKLVDAFIDLKKEESLTWTYTSCFRWLYW